MRPLVKLVQGYPHPASLFAVVYVVFSVLYEWNSPQRSLLVASDLIFLYGETLRFCTGYTKEETFVKKRLL